jgi:hypothetical protein
MPRARCPYAAIVKVREPVDRPLDVVAAELLLSISQAFAVGVLLYLAVGAWAEREIGAGTIAAILVALAFAVGGAWLYWLLGGIGLPLAAAELPVALFLGFAALLGLRGDELVALDPLALALTLAAAVYGIVAGVFLDSPRRLRWDQRRTTRRREPVPRVTPATAAWVARVRGVRPTPSSGASATAASRAGAVPPPVERAPSPSPTAVEVPPPPAPEPPRQAPTVAAPAVPAKPVTPTRAPTRTGATAAAPRPAASPTSTPPDPLELPTSVEPRAQRSPWAWARPPEWNREEERFEDDGEDDRA